ncbi:MAG: tRNA (adenosine(37)-N6)-threonylcarbamoyltransferase complex dimerization subunit type 1 TsaB [Deltaproteobacteria bacterium]|jgi:tRNA threonylcarbamoyl adenosine modification protein YeaZ|nr:tRNA (adenosine(37)-N6)-threonylcarbamoyltransferase complex dimerization subunit type 1 TsaB [Deltaproteobacteria bacterium]
MTTGLTLALGAAEGALQIAVGDKNGRLIYGQWIDAASRGAELLAPAIRDGLACIRKSTEDIAKIAVVRGPGSFTGLRLTAATSAGLARTNGAKQAGLDHMRLVARASLPTLLSAPEDAHLWSLVRARRDLLYMQAFTRARNLSPPFRALTELAVVPVSTGEAARLILALASQHGASRVLLAGSGVEEHRNALVMGLAVPDAPRVSLLGTVVPMADILLAEALDARYGDEDIEPLYARPSDAEENLPQIAQRLGLDPDEAVRELRAITRSKPGAGGES